MELDTEEFKAIEGETIKCAVLVDETTLRLEFASGRTAEIAVGDHMGSPEAAPFLYLNMPSTTNGTPDK